MALKEEIAERSKEIITDNYSMSVGELVSMYKEGDLEIHPEFQRFYRWTDSQKSRLIESFLLNFPVPPIFVYQRPDGVWDVVDGLQRVSTILHFAGVYKNEDGIILPPLRLLGTKLLPSLEGKEYYSENDPDNSFGDSERRYFKKARLDVIILKKESDSTGQYEVFQRLNTGGTALSPQEIRNCLMVMTSREKYRIVKSMAEYPNYLQSIALDDKSLENRTDMDLVTRFICLRHVSDPNSLKSIRDAREFFDDRIVELFKDESIDWGNEARVFETTFDAIFSALGDEAFCKYDVNAQRFKGGLYFPAFEFIAIVIGRHDGVIDKDSLRDRVINLWEYISQKGITWQGRNFRSRINEILGLGEKLYE